jgi:hypothetical protein
VTIEGSYIATAQDAAEAKTVLTPPGRMPGSARPPKEAAGTTRGLFGWILFLALAVLIFLWLQRQQAANGGRPSQRLLTPQLMLGIAGLVLGIVMLACGAVLLPRTRRILGKVISVALDDDGVRVERGGRRDSWRWQHFGSFAETENLFVLRHAVPHGRAIPKRAFGSGEQVAAAREFIALKLLPPPLETPSAEPPPLPPRADVGRSGVAS